MITEIHMKQEQNKIHYADMFINTKTAGLCIYNLNV